MTVFILLCLISLVLGIPDCSNIQGPAGSSYDLSSIVGVELELSDTFSIYKAKICKNDYPDCGQCGVAGYCQSNEFFTDCIGKFSIALGMVGTEGVELVYDQGDWGNIGRIYLLCDPTAHEITGLYQENYYKTFIARSKYACLTQSITCSHIPGPSVPGPYYDLSAIVGVELELSDTFSIYKAKICKNDYPDCGQCGVAGYCQSNEFFY